MVRRSLIVSLLLIVLSVLIHRSPTYMNIHSPNITINGIDEMGIQLALAYPVHSWEELVLTNKSEHHIIAAVVLYELIREDGKRLFVRDIICHPQISLESNPAKIRELLANYPVVPPQSNWLVGFGVDRTQLTRGLPSFHASRSLVSQELMLDPPPQSVCITIDGAILDDGRIVGPQKDSPKQWIITM